MRAFWIGLVLCALVASFFAGRASVASVALPAPGQPTTEEIMAEINDPQRRALLPTRCGCGATLALVCSSCGVSFRTMPD